MSAVQIIVSYFAASIVIGVVIGGTVAFLRRRYVHRSAKRGGTLDFTFICANPDHLKNSTNRNGAAPLTRPAPRPTRR